MRTPTDPASPDPLTAGTTRRDAERELVAGLLMGHRDTYEAAATIIGPGDFAGARCRATFERIGAAHTAGRPIPPMDLRPDVVAEWGEPGWSSIAGAWEHAKRVKVHAVRARLRVAADQLARTPHDTRSLDALDEARAALAEMEELHAVLSEHAATRAAACVDDAQRWGPWLAAERVRYDAMTRAELLDNLPAREPVADQQAAA